MMGTPISSHIKPILSLWPKKSKKKVSYIIHNPHKFLVDISSTPMESLCRSTKKKTVTAITKALPATSSPAGAHDLPALLHGFHAAALAGPAVPGPIPGRIQAIQAWENPMGFSHWENPVGCMRLRGFYSDFLFFSGGFDGIFLWSIWIQGVLMVISWV